MTTPTSSTPSERPRCEESVNGRMCKRRARYRVQTPGGTWLMCDQHAQMVVTWSSEGGKVYVHDLD